MPGGMNRRAKFLPREDNLPEKGEAGERPHAGTLSQATCQRQDNANRQFISGNLPLSPVRGAAYARGHESRTPPTP